MSREKALDPDVAMTAASSGTRYTDSAAMLAVISEYAVIPRLPTSDGEREVATRLNARFAGLGYRTEVQKTPATSSYAAPIGLLSIIGAAAGLAGGVARWASALICVAVAVVIAEDISGGRRWFRRVTMRRRTAYNVVAEVGASATGRTIVVLAHHDAAPSGVVFDQRLIRALVRRFPKLMAKLKTSPPAWWPVIVSPIVAAVGSASGLAVIRYVGVFCCVIGALAMADVLRRPAVPGANDNLSGVAAMLNLADRLAVEPAAGVRVLFLCAGAEEALQEGIRGFFADSRDHFAPDTVFINLETVGSGRLALLEGEGPVLMHDYEPGFKDLASRCADKIGVPLTRGLRSRNSTDSELPRRYGYPVATIVSLDEDRLLPHYHLDSDLPEYVDLACTDAAARLAEKIIRTLAAG